MATKPDKWVEGVKVKGKKEKWKKNRQEWRNPLWK